MHKLKQDFLEKCKTDLSISKYVLGRLDEQKRYRGWVGNQGETPTYKTLKLNLNLPNDQFLLYCLASAWSASGQWENAATLVYAMKSSHLDLSSPIAWSSEKFEKSKSEAKENFYKNKDIFQPRRKVNTPREDIFPAIRQLAIRWNHIQKSMLLAHKNSDWESFVYELREIKGLAPGNRCLNIKIPLILRELRCQNIFENIPGGLCCVPDARVINAIKYLKIKGRLQKDCNLSTYRPSDAKTLIKFSKAIYTIYGDLYDIPLFAVPDLYQDFKDVLNKKNDN
jgi:hypothetical protein